MNRNLTIGAIATAAALALPAAASAHSLAPGCAPDGQLQVTLTNWPSTVLDDLTVTVNDVVVRSGPYSAPSFDAPVLIGPFQGPLNVVATGTMTDGRRFTSRVGLVCITPPPPDETPRLPDLPVTGPAPVVVQVVTPGPDRPPVVKLTPHSVRHTCADLRRLKAGARWYTRLGHYPGCVVPRSIVKPRPRRHVAVAG